MLNPDFTDDRLQPQGQLYFCPFNAMLEGVLKYYPNLHQHLDITHINFQRPRNIIVEMVGEENQDMPLLIIKNVVANPVIGIKQCNDHKFIVGAENILKYLAINYHVPLPHP